MNKIHKVDTRRFTKIVSIQVHLQVLALILKMILGRINAFPQCLCSQIDEIPEDFSMVLKFMGFTSLCFHMCPQREEGQRKAFS